MNAVSAKSLPVVYACSGCSDAGELADQIARQLARDGSARMSCLAGVGGRVKSLLNTAKTAQRILVIDGCPLNCARHTLLGAGITDFEHLALQDVGFRKGGCPATRENVARGTGVATLLLEGGPTAAPRDPVHSPGAVTDGRPGDTAFGGLRPDSSRFQPMLPAAPETGGTRRPGPERLPSEAA